MSPFPDAVPSPAESEFRARHDQIDAGAWRDLWASLLWLLAVLLLVAALVAVPVVVLT